MIINDPTHNGPPGSRHGGVAASHFAKLVDPHRPRTRFHAFVPLGVPPTGHLADDGAIAISHGVTLLATGAPTDPVELFPDLPVPELADEVRSYAVERDRRRFPTRCGCDPARPERNSLQLRPAAQAKRNVHASTSRPILDSTRPACLIWAALDSGSAGPALADAPDGASIVTGELAAEVRQTVPGYATAMIDQDPTP